MTNALYNSGKVKLGDGSIDWDGATIKAALLTSSYTPDVDAHDFWDDVSANEVAASGTYSAGGITLTCQVTQDNTNDRAIYDANDFSVTGFSGAFRYLVLYKSTGTPGTSALIGYIDLGATVVSNGTVAITVNAAGLFNLT